MEDSGFDSEEKLTTTVSPLKIENTDVNNKEIIRKSDDDDSSSSSSSNNLNVEFREPKLDSKTEVQNEIKNCQMSSCKILQRKLELKVERAKKNYNKFQEHSVKKTKSSNLIPISRLAIPGYTENQPLVDYKSESEDDIDDISFFPSSKKLKNSRKQELSDTFSIQEMSIESDDNNSDDSGNLELLPPRKKNSIVDQILSCFHCNKYSTINTN